MDKPNDTAENTESVEASRPWGTWEELLLSCAVHRHGTDNWDAVAVEIQKRSSAPSTLPLLTPSICEQKYRDLKRRYSPPNDAAAVNDDDKGNDEDAVPWLDELRKLRVAELKREVERYDVSIVSLQLKVKRLKEEREEVLLREDEKSDGGEMSDLEKTGEREREDEQNREGEITPASVAGEPVSGGDNQSVNESNSTDPNKIEKDSDSKEPEPVRTGEGDPDNGTGSTKPVGENSCNGSSNSIEKEEETVRESVKDEPGGGRGDSPELWESVAESKGAAAVKESSDVQSSASKSRKEELGDDKVRSGCVSGDEPEDVDQSPAVKQDSVESRSLVDFLEIVRSHKLGSVFERRLESQETPEYKNLIRQHVDLETIQTRLKEGWYSSFNGKFYRDLLLLFSNAILFFSKGSRESTVAIELWQLLSKEMAQTNLEFNSSAEKRTPTLSLLVLPSNPEPEPSSDSLLLKPKMISGPMIFCRKRSSIAAKALIGSSNSGGADRKREQKAEEKPILDWKQPNRRPSGNNAEENDRVTKKRTSDRFASAGSRSSKKNGKNRSSPNPNASKNLEPLSSELSEPKSEKNTATPTTVSGGAKKRSAANFLSRMKRSSTTTNNNGSTLLDTLKSSGLSSGMNNRGGGGEQKRSGGNGKGGDSKKEQAATSRRGSEVGGQAKEKEQGSPAKRNVGRPKRAAAAAPPSTTAATSRKRSREGGGGGDKEAGASKQPKKRSRR